MLERAGEDVDATLSQMFAAALDPLYAGMRATPIAPPEPPSAPPPPATSQPTTPAVPPRPKR
jgi:hypothetical protein